MLNVGEITERLTKFIAKLRQSHGLDGVDLRALLARYARDPRAIAKPPYLAYPLVGGMAYTFGGLATNTKAEVLGEQGPMPGLYAAGETTGHFYGTAPNAVAELRALVFGRIAGEQAVDLLQKQIAQSQR